jgi:hypothetical protein
MLTLFALGITPKIAIHALVAHHTDSCLSLEHKDTDQLNTAVYSCATDNLVVELPFLGHSLSIKLGLRPSFAAFPTASLEEPLSALHPLFGLRGPPASFFL